MRRTITYNHTWPFNGYSTRYSDNMTNTPAKFQTRNKAVYVDFNEYLAIEDGNCWYCLDNRHVAWLLAQITYFEWRTRWDNLTFTPDALQSEADRMRASLMTCGCDDLQTIINNQATNSYVASEYARIQQNAIREGLYDGTPTSVNPNVPSDFEGMGTDGSNALCNAVNQYVRVKMLEAVNLIRSLFGVQLLAAGALGLLTGGLGWFVGGVSLLVGSVTLLEYEDAIADTGALDAVVCNLKALLVGTVSQANFTAAINALSSSDPNKNVIITTLQQGAGDLTNYLYFLDLLGTAQELAVNGIYTCPVCPTTIELALTQLGGAVVTLTRIQDEIIDVNFTGGSGAYKWYVSDITNPSGSLAGTPLGGVNITSNNLGGFAIEVQSPIDTPTMPFNMTGKFYCAAIDVGNGIQAALSTSAGVRLEITIQP